MGRHKKFTGDTIRYEIDGYFDNGGIDVDGHGSMLYSLESLRLYLNITYRSGANRHRFFY